MDKQWGISIANIDDAKKIIDLTDKSFSSDQKDLFLYGCHGAGKYLSELIKLQEFGSDSVFLVAKREDEVLGYVEIRRLFDSICLNYMATAESARGMGVYKKLMIEALRYGEKEGYNKTFHDVFFGNSIRDFHERIGYIKTNTFNWLAIEIPSIESNGRITLFGLPQADVVHRNFGFSQFTLASSKGTYQIGRLGEKWFRLSTPDILNDNHALSALKKLDENRLILGIFSEGASIPANFQFEQVLGSYRLEGNINTVLSYLV